MRKLASIQRIDNLAPIEKADNIEMAKVLGWTLVVKKGEFKQGDLCVYFEIDGMLPDIPTFEFINKATIYTLKCENCPAITPVPAKNKDDKIICPNCKNKKTRVVGGYEKRKDKSRKLSTKKMRGVISQGLAMPLGSIRQALKELHEEDESERAFTFDDDLTGALEVTKYEPPINPRQAGNIKCRMPFYIPKTEETRIQSIPNILDEIFYGREFYTTVKLDGTSGTFAYKDGEIDICSRNLSLKDSVAEGSSSKDDFYWHVAKKYDIPRKLKDFGKNIALQGEICGPGIQKNRLGLSEIKLFLFDVYLIDEQRYVDFSMLCLIAGEFEIPMVPIISEHLTFGIQTILHDKQIVIDHLLESSEGKYAGTKNQREGIVIRPIKTTHSEVLGGRMSFKVISNKFLLKNRD